MLAPTWSLLLTELLSSLCGITVRTPPYNKAFAVLMFNATLPATQFLTPGLDFYNNTLGWNATRQAAFKEKAMLYFREKFGFVNPEDNPNLTTMLFSTNPLANTTCVDLSGEKDMPIFGYSLKDGGWIIIVTNPQGITLGGEFPGVHVPQGTTFTIGHWLIVREGKPNILWDFHYLSPGIIATPNLGRISHGEIRVNSKEWGQGFSLPVTKYVIDANGTANALYRNVITF